MSLLQDRTPKPEIYITSQPSSVKAGKVFTIMAECAATHVKSGDMCTAQAWVEDGSIKGTLTVTGTERGGHFTFDFDNLRLSEAGTYNVELFLRMGPSHGGRPLAVVGETISNPITVTK